MGKDGNNKNRKILIDLDNSPHVPFFYPIINALRKEGFQVVITARNYAQVIGLTELYGIECTPLGRHYGKSTIFKLVGLLLRSAQLWPLLIAEKPDLVMSHGSRPLGLVSRLSRIRSVLLMDYEHSSWLTFFKPTLLMVPEALNVGSVARYAKHVAQYHGIKEDVYVPFFEPGRNVITDLGINQDNVVVTMRPPATLAHYHCRKSEQLFEDVVEFIGQKENITMIILPRTKDQGVSIREKWPMLFAESKIIIPENVLNGLDLIWYSDLVVSGGGTMIREAAALNIPSYSVFGGVMGDVDKCLMEEGRLTILHSKEDIYTKVDLKKRAQTHNARMNTSVALDEIIKETKGLLCA